ncbi:hypothetical protein B0H10DRAFT_2438382 [Mycena sp. CBHHK59/15]|nr:hypothetical protein B0H10DRAFT_2438382 [Mycena sp. CBHHK59/15]
MLTPKIFHSHHSDSPTRVSSVPGTYRPCPLSQSHPLIPSTAVLVNMSDPLDKAAAAEKRAKTKARRDKEKAQEDQRLIAAGAGTRRAKDTALEKAIRKDDAPGGRKDDAKGGTIRKRGSSTVQEPPKRKKSRPADASDEEPKDQPPAEPARRATISSRDHPAPAIGDSDEDKAAESKKATGAAKPKKPSTQKAAPVKKTKGVSQRMGSNRGQK